MHVIDLEGNEYPLQATTTNEKEVNGNQSLTATILATNVNREFISDIKEMWRIVDHDNVEHKIIYAKRKGIGRYTPEHKNNKTDDSSFSTQLKVDIKAIPLFFDDFDNSRIYDNINKHMTAVEAFTTLFKGMNYDFVLVDQFDAVQWEGFGAGESRLETFKRCLERYKCEFRIAGNVIYLERQIGRDTQFQYRHRLNSTNIEEEIDAAEMWTYAKGYGNYGNENKAYDDDGDTEDWENAKLIEEYTSPLADIIGIRHAPPIKDGRITRKAKMQEKLKELVDESLKISVSADVIDLQKQGYPVAQSEVGDRVFLIDERIGLDDEVRVISQSKTRNWKGDVIDLNITFGSEGIEKRHRSQLTTAAKDIQDLIAGRKKLPYSVLPAAEQNALRALNEARTELIFGSNENGIQGIIAQEKDDPNRLMWINSAGWMISTDGGATSKVAATADGIVADVIYAGILNADQVAIMGGDGNSYAYISGAYAEFRGTFKQTWLGDTNTYDIKTMLQNGYLRFRNDTEESSLYLSWNGLSTFVDGVGGDEDDAESGRTSGSIFWWDKTYSQANPATSGITVYSWGGTATLESERHHALIKSRYSTDIQSTESNVKITTHTDETKRGFTFTKSQDRLDGYLLFGDNNTAGLRFSRSSDGIIQVINSDNLTGGSTEIEAGLGTFNIVRRRSGTNYLSLQNENYFKVGLDSDDSPRVASDVIRRRSASNSANVFITDSGTLGRSSSSERYKVNIDNQFADENAQLEHSKKILNLNIKKWNDKFETETLCKEIEEGKRLSVESFRLDKYVGLTSEDVQSVGLEEHVEKSDEGLEGIEYDRLWIHLIPIIKDQQVRIEELEASK